MNELFARLPDTYTCLGSAAMTGLTLLGVPLIFLNLFGVFFVWPRLLNHRLDPIFANTKYIAEDRLDFSWPPFLTERRVRAITYLRAVAGRDGCYCSLDPKALKLRPRPYLSKGVIGLCIVGGRLMVSMGVVMFVVLLLMGLEKIHDDFYGFKPRLLECPRD